MTENDRPKFAEAMHALGETFNEPVSDIRAEAYFDALRDVPLAQVAVAVRLAIRTCRYFPKPVELREMVTGQSGELADKAWGDVLTQIRRVGYMGTPTFEDGRIEETIRQVWGSWRRLCETLPGEGPELVGWVKQFKSVFASVANRGEIEAFSNHALPDGLKHALGKMAAQKVLR